MRYDGTAAVTTRLNLNDLSPDLKKKIYGDDPVPTPAYSRSPNSRQKDPEETFVQQCRAYKLPMFRREYKFATSLGRGWMFDFAWLSIPENPDCKIALEVEGIVCTRVNGELRVTGRHVHPQGFRNDCVKYATAAILGWSVLRFEQTQVTDGTAIDMAIDMLKAKGHKS